MKMFFIFLSFVYLCACTKEVKSIDSNDVYAKFNEKLKNNAKRNFDYTVIIDPRAIYEKGLDGPEGPEGPSSQSGCVPSTFTYEEWKAFIESKATTGTTFLVAACSLIGCSRENCTRGCDKDVMPYVNFVKASCKDIKDPILLAKCVHTATKIIIASNEDTLRQKGDCEEHASLFNLAYTELMAQADGNPTSGFEFMCNHVVNKFTVTGCGGQLYSYIIDVNLTRPGVFIPGDSNACRIGKAGFLPKITNCEENPSSSHSPSPDSKHLLSVRIFGEGNVSGYGINCNPDCTEAYDKFDTIVLNVKASDGYELSSLRGCSNNDEALTSGVCLVTMTDNKTVSAVFETIEDNPPQDPEPQCSEYSELCATNADCCNPALECGCVGSGACDPSSKHCKIPQCASGGQKCGSIPLWLNDPGATAQVYCCNANHSCQGSIGNQICVGPQNPTPTNPPMPTPTCASINQNCSNSFPCCDTTNNECKLEPGNTSPNIIDRYKCLPKQVCQSNSTSCTAGSQCCSGTCLNGQCANPAPACKSELQMCTLSSECCNGTCQFSTTIGTKVCSANHAPQCRGSGATCTTASECCAGFNCTDFLMNGVKTCRSQDLPLICRADSLSCTSSAQCCRGLCQNGVCGATCKTVNQSCGTAAEGNCCSGLSCSAGKCIDLQPACPVEMRNGRECSTWRNCCSSYCNSHGRCAAPP